LRVRNNRRGSVIADLNGGEKNGVRFIFGEGVSRVARVDPNMNLTPFLRLLLLAYCGGAAAFAALAFAIASATSRGM